MWGNVNKIIGKYKDKLHTRSLLINECEISDETDITNTFNNYFTVIGPNSIQKSLPLIYLR